MSEKPKINLRSHPQGEGKNLYCVFSDGSGSTFLANDDEHLIEQVCEAWSCEDDTFGYEYIGTIEGEEEDKNTGGPPN
jgi:hypothetical protein